MRRFGQVAEVLVAVLGIAAIFSMGGGGVLVGALVVAAVSIALLRYRH